MKSSIRSRINKPDSSGFSMMEVVLAIGISAIVLGGVVTTMTIVNRGGSQFNLLQARNEIINKIRVQAMNPANLIASAKVTDSLGEAGLPHDYGPPSTLAKPELLQKCIPDIGGTETYGCDKTTLEDLGRGFKFYLAENGSLDPERTIAGEDVYYRNTGLRCTGPEAANPSLCPLEARAWFEPFCLNFASACTKAMSVAVRYSIGIRSDLVDNNLAVPTVEGEFYIPLQRGIQIRNLLSQTDAVVTPNNKGIFTIPKFYTTTQAISGLRFETQVSNPYGLVSMRIQMRSLTGPSAREFGELGVPEPLLSREWNDVGTPGNTSLGAWSINLAGAVPNQVFNFGRQTTVAADSRSPRVNFPIGSSNSTSTIYRWTLNGAKTAFLPPSFQSGFYQFRVLATDVLGKEVESTNYITVRIIGSPEFAFTNNTFEFKRDCVNATQPYKIFVGDDEEVIFSEVKVSETVVASNPINGTNGSLEFNLMKHQPPGDYPIKVTIRNRFSDVPLETVLINKVDETFIAKLSDITPSTDGIVSSPDKIRRGQSGSVSLNFSSGNCCQATPSIQWQYPNSPVITPPGPLLSGPNNSTMACTISENTRSCYTTINATGETESPSPFQSSHFNIQATLVMGENATDSACNLPNGVGQLSRHIPVILLPTISFVLPESLWLTIPGPSIKSTTPRVGVKIDFSPELPTTVNVSNAADPSEVFCTLSFEGGTGVTPIFKYCNIPPSFNGLLSLTRPPSETKLQLPWEPVDQIHHKAKVADQYNHTVCQPNITSLGQSPANYTVPSTLPMLDSPYGTIDDGQGGTVQHPKNDAGQWTAGRQKVLRCYDEWTNNTSDPYLKQDYQDLFLENLNRGTNQKKNTKFALKTFASYLVPNNPPLLVDTSAASIPYLFLVHQEGQPGMISWGLFDSGTGATATTAPQPWQNITNQLCGGSASLSQTQLYRTRLSVESNSGNIIMRAANRFSSVEMSGAYSYAFMCAYGRWHPSGNGSNTWVD